MPTITIACAAACGIVCGYSCNVQSSPYVSYRLLLCLHSERALLLRLVVVTEHLLLDLLPYVTDVVYLFLQAQQQPLAPAAHFTNFAAVSLSNVIATSCQYEALKYVAFPVQTLGKCAKMIPVMIWGTLISGKTYSAKDYTAALLVTAGCTGFLLSRGAESKTSGESSLLGGILMLTYLMFDGFTSTFQVTCKTIVCHACHTAQQSPFSIAS